MLTFHVDQHQISIKMTKKMSSIVNFSKIVDSF